MKTLGRVGLDSGRGNGTYLLHIGPPCWNVSHPLFMVAPGYQNASPYTAPLKAFRDYPIEGLVLEEE
jgi:hypothetical protein